MLTLRVFGKAFSEPSASPFSVKAMCLMQMSGAAWHPLVSHDPRKAPKGKFPVLEDDGCLIPDTSQIAAYLEAKLNIDFNKGLSAGERAQSHALQRMAEEHLYFALVSDRWGRDDVWAFVRAQYFGRLPAPVRRIVPSLIRKTALKRLQGQGMGRHSPDEIVARAALDIGAVQAHLGERAFLFGARPTLADASVAPMLAAIADCPVETPLKRLVADKADLMAYLARVRAAIYPPATLGTSERARAA